MAIYLCEGECGQMLDGDYFPSVEHPTDDTLNICEECADTLEEELKDLAAENERTETRALSSRQENMQNYGLKEGDFK